jgi:hypothetical protein
MELEVFFQGIGALDDGGSESLSFAGAPASAGEILFFGGLGDFDGGGLWNYGLGIFLGLFFGGWRSG